MEQNPNKVVKIFSDLVGLFDSKPRAFTVVALILVILYLYSRNERLSDLLLSQKDQYNKDIVAEVRKQIKPEIQGIKDTLKAGIDSNKKIVDSTRSELKPLIKGLRDKFLPK